MELMDDQAPLESFNDKMTRWFLGNEGAVHFMATIFDVMQQWDDMWDEGVPRETTDDLLVYMAFTKEEHPYFAKYAHLLRGQLLSCWLKWQAANALEETPCDVEDIHSDLVKSYMLRAGFYDLVHLVAWIEGGTQHARAVAAEVYRSYGETPRQLIEEILSEGD